MNGEIVVYRNFHEFYPFYLSEHLNPINRKLHFIGATTVLILTSYILLTGSWWLFPLNLLFGYGFSWIGHFFFERNKPATFQYPLYSLRGDFTMWFDIVRGKQSISPKRRLL